MDNDTLKKGITFAAMLTYIRSSVVEQMLPAAPYLLRFNIDDYTYFTDYVRDKCLGKVYREGLYDSYLESCSELKDYLMKTQGQLTEKEAFWTIEKLASPALTPLSKEAGTWDERYGDEGSVEKTMSLYEQYMVIYGHGTQLQAESFLKEWKRIEKQKSQINFESGENSPLHPDSGLEVDAGKGGKKTPYMLSNFYGNVYPIGKRHLEANVEEDNFWSTMGSFLMGMKMFSVNGVPMTPGEALKRALIMLCFKPDAFGALIPGGTAEPTRVQDYGSIGFQAFSKAPMIVPSDLLDALIVLETTAFINKVKSLKEDPSEDWDWPIDFSKLFFNKLLPRPYPKLADLYLHSGDANTEDAMIKSFLFPKRIMYVPVIDTHPFVASHADGNLGISELAASPGVLLAKEALLNNFPWAYDPTTHAQDGYLDREEAKEMVAQPSMDPATGAPIITNTLGGYQVLTDRIQLEQALPHPFMSVPGLSDLHTDQHRLLKGALPGLLAKRAMGDVKYGTDQADVLTWDQGFVEDKYNGGTHFHMKTSGFVLQMYAYIDSYLWERVDEETLETVETPGLRRLLYLFGNRGYNLKGAVNPHYWNACMKEFFDHIEEKSDGAFLEFTENDLQMFKNRMGAEYADIKMGLRLCWMVPSNMPNVFDEKHPESGKVWWGKTEYGDQQLIDAYKSIKNDPDMHKKFLEEKCHAYVVNHKQHKVTWTHKKNASPDDFQGYIATQTDTLHPESQISEYAFCFPLCEVLSDKPAILDPENWNIMPESLSLKRNPDHLINKLIKKMGEDEDFRILFEYIFPIKSIIPEIATIYGMEFFKPVSDFMSVQKDYFGPVRNAASSIVKSFQKNNSYDTDLG